MIEELRRHSDAMVAQSAKSWIDLRRGRDSAA